MRRNWNGVKVQAGAKIEWTIAGRFASSCLSLLDHTTTEHETSNGSQLTDDK